MAYFSNSDEGWMFQSKFCANCAHETDDDMCIVWMLHYAFNGDKQKSEVLDMLIPENKETCHMFIDRSLLQAKQYSEIKTTAVPLKYDENGRLMF